MSVRPQTSTLDRLSSLSMSEPERKAFGSQQREPSGDVAVDSAGQGLVQRCVVVQKDSLGFGFTVCGERIKLVQNVRTGGAAMKAGVQEGDRIIKVNGSLVSSMTHQEVVKLIKSGTYVALTLQGPPPSAAAVPLQPLPTDISLNNKPETTPPPPPPLPPEANNGSTERITGPKPLQDPKVQKHASQILRKMLEQEEAELQYMMEEMSRNPSHCLVERIESAKRRAQQVRVKVQQDLDGMRSEKGGSYLLTGEGRLSLDSGEGDFEGSDSPHSSPSFFSRSHLRTSSDTHSSSDSGMKAQIIGPEEDDEDESYIASESDGPFQDIEMLKTRPAHMTVFMRYVFSQLLDPNPLLFYLSVEAYLSSGTKDARSIAPQICTHFLDLDAPLKIKAPEEFLSDIESRLQAQEDIRGPLSELQQLVLPDIQEQIQDYRTKQLMGLGSLFGEGDLQQLDGDPVKERQVVDRQVTALWELLSKHEEERSAPLASAVLRYLRHVGIKLRDSRSLPGVTSEKDKWLPFLTKSKKMSSGKKEKDGEDRKRNPILKYIGKPRSTSQSTFHVPLSPSEVRSGNVRNIIQQFESHHPDPLEGDGELHNSFGDDALESPTVSVRLARSESLKAQGEGRRRGAGGDAVPRSRSDVDMEDCADDRDGTGLNLLQHSTSSSSSARSLENATPPYTPHSRRRSVDSPAVLLPDAPLLEEDTGDAHTWRETVDPHTLAALGPREAERQAVIYELFTTEQSHLRTLRVLDQVFFQRMRSVLSSEELACIFPNLPQVYELHASLCDSMKKLRESAIVQGIGDTVLARFEGEAGAEFQEQASQLCSQQSQALELIKNKQRRDPRFAHIIQECEANPLCRRLQLKDLLVSEMQRVTKYPLLLDNIIKHTEPLSADLPSLHRAQSCCRGILQAVNEVVRETEHRQRLSQYQRRLDSTALERQTSPVAAQFKNLDLSTKKMIHEGPLTWRVSREKALEVQALLLSDLLVLLQRGPDERLVLRCPSRTLGGGVGGSGEPKTFYSPVVRLDTLLVRPVATDNKALYVISTSERQIYELVAGTSSEKNTWKDLLEKTISQATRTSSPAGHSSPTVSSPGLDMDSSISVGNHVFQPEESLSEESMTRDTPTEEARMATPTPPPDQSHALTEDRRRPGVADSALQDVETLRQLIFTGFEEDSWSQGSDNTPTNESNPLVDGLASEALDSPTRLDKTDTSVQVVRKAEGAGSASLPDDITDVHILPSQSDEAVGGAMAQGNTFYLVLPHAAGESTTEEPSDVAECPSSETQETVPDDLGRQLQSHVIRNVDEIFHTMEALTSKLQRLREIETAHHRLLKTLAEPSANQALGDPSQTPPPLVNELLVELRNGEGGDVSQTTVQSTSF